MSDIWGPEDVIRDFKSCVRSLLNWSWSKDDLVDLLDSVVWEDESDES